MVVYIHEVGEKSDVGGRHQKVSAMLLLSRIIIDKHC